MNRDTEPAFSPNHREKLQKDCVLVVNEKKSSDSQPPENGSGITTIESALFEA